MTGEGGKNKPEKRIVWTPEEKKEIAGFTGEHPFLTKIADAAIFAAIIATATFSGDPQRSLFSSEGRRTLFSRDENNGLLMHSIFNNELYSPNGTSTSLGLNTASAGAYIGYDFRRKTQIGENAHSLRVGRLYAFYPDEIKGREIDDYTPTGIVRMLSLEYLATFDHYSLDYLESEGLIVQTNYQRAYEKVGKFRQFKNFLDLVDRTDKTVYSVTPKGNGLVFLFSEGGEAEKKPESEVARSKRLGTMMPAPAY